MDADERRGNTAWEKPCVTHLDALDGCKPCLMVRRLAVADWHLATLLDTMRLLVLTGRIVSGGSWYHMVSSFALMLRSLRMDARQYRWHLMRFGLVAILLWLLWVSQWDFTPNSAPGREFFSWIAWTDAVLLFLGGPIIFGMSITEEKEERTLQLLKIANVSPLSILSGKVVPLLFSVFLVLLIQFPLTLLAITLGGVDLNQVAAAFLSLLAFLFFIAWLSTLCSTVFRHSGTAIGVALGLEILFFLAPAIGYLILGAARFILEDPETWKGVGAYLNALARMNVFTRLDEVLVSGFEGDWIGMQVTSNLLLGLACGGLAWGLFDPCNQTLEEVASTRQTRKKLAAVPTKEGTVSLVPSRRCWNAAIMWRDYVYLAGGHRMLLLKVFGYGALIVLVFATGNISGAGNGISFNDMGAVILWVATFMVLPLELAVLVGRTYRSEIKDKTLTTLMMLPRTTRELAYSKMSGSLLATIPTLGYIVLGLIMCPDVPREMWKGFIDEPPMSLIVSALILSHALLYLHLTSYFSVLSNTWIGILGAGIVQWIGMATLYFTVAFLLFSVIRVFGQPSEGWAYALGFSAILFNVVLIVVLQLAIGRTLERKAAES